MKRHFLHIGLISVFVFSALSNAESKDVVGWIEKVRICPGNVVVHAKLDTGADNCSLNAPHIEFFHRGNDTWVRFDLTNREGKTVTFERKTVRIAKIKRKGAKCQERPVILLGICIGSVYKEVEVNLVDRSHYKYQMLIGRKFLKGDLLIDSSVKYTVEPQCKEPRRISE
jgi:hypothetical protein